jgi:Fic family protein
MAQYSNEVQTLLTRIDSLQAQVDELRPIKPELLSKIFQKYRLDWNYNSNSIEGNSLNYGETVAFIMEGLTAKGKPLKDHLDIKGHNKAIDFLMDMQKQGTELMERDIRGLHEMILVEPYESEAQTADGQKTTKTIRLGVYKSSPNHVKTATGQIHYYASPEETPAMMQELMEWYRENRLTLHPLVLSTLFHHRFVGIHPFDDGNGRMSRLLSNLILMQAGYPPVVVRKDEKTQYYGVLSQADAGVTDPLLEYFAGLLIRSLETYLKGARGEDISDPSDLDKELSLFIGSFDEEIINKVPLTQEMAEGMLVAILEPFFEELMPRIRKINSLFFENEIQLVIVIYDENNSVKNNAEYNEIESEEFYNDWTKSKKVALTALRAQMQENYKAGYTIRLRFNFIHKGFKAKEAVKQIDSSIILDLERSHASFLPVETGDRVDKPYPKPFSKNDYQKVLEQFLRDVMAKIQAAYTGPASGTVSDAGQSA